MNIYDEKTKKKISNPDMTSGYVYEGTIVTGRTEETVEVMEDTKTDDCPEGLRAIVPAADIVEECQYYHEYTEEEIENKKNEKLDELRTACNEAIKNGTEIDLEHGKKKRFTYTIEDQANIGEMYNAMRMGATEYPYHASDDSCEIYSAKDIITIYAALAAYKTGQTTYHNLLKQYVKTLKKYPEIHAVTYGQKLTGEYLEKYNQLLASAEKQMQIVIGNAAKPTL